LSLAHFSELCGNDALQEAYRQAVTKLLNLLSNEQEPVRPTALGTRGRLLAINLADLGWTSEQWEELAQSTPRGALVLQSDQTIAATGSSVPVLAADRLAFLASKPGAYEGLLRDSPTRRELLDQLSRAGSGQASFETAEIAKSEITGYARTLRHGVIQGRRSVWEATDFAPDSTPIQRRIIYRLANGFPAFTLLNRRGDQRSVIHKSVRPDVVAQAGNAAAGLTCMSCHSVGPLSSAETSSASSLFTEAIESDAAAIAQSMRAAGIDPGLRIDGLEPVRALALRFTRQLDLLSAAAELALSPNELRTKLSKVSGRLHSTAMRLTNGLVDRAEFDELAAHPAIANASPGIASRPPSDAMATASYWTRPSTLKLSLWLEKAAYEPGDELVVFASATQPCRLTLISRDANENAVVLFPSEFQDDNHLKPWTTLRVPGLGEKFTLRVEHPNKERIVGICMAGERANPPGIFHDFELQRFTLLGTWTQHLTSALAYDFKERQNASKKSSKRKRQRSRRRRRSKQLPYRASKLPLAQVWASIEIPGKLEKTNRQD
jgi:hypothetical protein